MDIGDIRKKAREKLKGYCKVCRSCDGQNCAGQVPGPGGLGTGNSFKANITALEEIKINMRTIGGSIPETSFSFLGHNLEAPVMGAPIAGMTYNYGNIIGEAEFANNVVKGCVDAGLIGMTGDGLSSLEYPSGLKAISAFDGKGIPFLKPDKYDETMIKIEAAEKENALAVGMDIDGTGLVSLKKGIMPKSKRDLARIISNTDLPFILKGIMTVDEAVIAAEIGAKAIVVSNHGGRVLDFTPGTAEVLPRISREVREEVIVLVDGGVRTGIDVLKMLGLGADAVLIGRPLVIGNFGAGSLGVKTTLEVIKKELIQGMIMTGCGNIQSIDNKILYR